jgi:hypothetical protein
VRDQGAGLAARLRALEHDQLARVERSARRRQRRAAGQPRGHRGEDVAAVERGRDRFQPPRRGRDLDRLGDAAEALGGRRQEAVVRTDQQAALIRGPQRHRPPPGADVGVDDGQVHPGRQVRQRALEHGGGGAHVVARDAVRDVDDAGVGADPGDHAVHDADELVGEPVVREEGDRARHRSTASIRPSGV